MTCCASARRPLLRLLLPASAPRWAATSLYRYHNHNLHHHHSYQRRHDHHDHRHHRHHKICSDTSASMMRLDASACMDGFTEFKSRKSDVNGLLFRVDDPREPHAIQLEQTVQKSGGSAEEDWAAFCAQLPADDCRYGLVSVSWDADDGHRASKSIFLLWSPSQAPIKTKMIYSASSSSLKSALQGAGVNYQAGDHASLEWAAVIEKAKSATTAR
jgi:cofilin